MQNIPVSITSGPEVKRAKRMSAKDRKIYTDYQEQRRQDQEFDNLVSRAQKPENDPSLLVKIEIRRKTRIPSNEDQDFEITNYVSPIYHDLKAEHLIELPIAAVLANALNAVLNE